MTTPANRPPIPQGLALTPDGAVLYIASASFARGGKTVNVLDTATDTEVAYVSVPRAQRDVAIAGNRAFAVTFAQTGANEVYTIDTDAVAAAVALAAAGGGGTVRVPAHLATTRLPNRAERIAAADPAPANAPPIAAAGLDQTVECGTGRTGCGCATVTLDGTGATDPDGDELTYQWEHDATGLTFSGAIQTDLPLELGTHSFTLTVDDGNGGTATDTVTITVEDTVAPTISGNAPATIIPPDAPISFTASASDSCTANPTVAITSYSCYAINGAGKRIDKSESCVVQINGATITILDSGGVGTHITWTVEASDSSPDSAEASADFEVEVVNPGKGKGKGRR